MCSSMWKIVKLDSDKAGSLEFETLVVPALKQRLDGGRSTLLIRTRGDSLGLGFV